METKGTGKNQLTIIKSHRDITTCMVNKVFLHSRYNPTKEASTLFESQLSIKDTSLNQITFLVGAALGYEIEVLQKMLPHSHLIPIYFDELLYEQSESPHKIFFREHELDELSLSLTRHLTQYATIIEEKHIQIVYWPPAIRAWPTYVPLCLKQINLTLRMFLSEQNTIQYFLSQWIRNACFHYLHIEDYYIPTLTADTYVVIAASGPSLNDSLDELKKKRSDFILVSVSSALECLFSHDIYPDIITHQDSSYYASQYLQNFPTNYAPYIAHPLQTSRGTLLHQYPSIILNTGQEPEILLQLTDSDSVRISQYATVLGSTLDFVWTLTKQQVFLVGFDLSINPAGSHCTPHFSNHFKHVGHSLDSYENIIARQFIQAPLEIAPPQAHLKQNNVLRTYADWFHAWKHPYKTARTHILSSRSLPHHEGMDVTPYLPNNIHTHTQAFNISQRHSLNFSQRRARIQLLAQYWEEIWYRTEKKQAFTRTYPQKMVDTLENIQTVLKKKEFELLLETIVGYTQ